MVRTTEKLSDEDRKWLEETVNFAKQACEECLEQIPLKVHLATCHDMEATMLMSAGIGATTAAAMSLRALAFLAAAILEANP